ncbi:MAG TPA: PH domain-containing protein [Acidimicrobiales bacterium]|nr:PH domain-containing protein [Acidimicrobiales bacterium]
MKDLADGESVVVDVRPHWWFLAGPVAVLAAVIAGSVAAIVAGVPGWVKWILLAVLVVAVGWMIGRYLRWYTTRLIVTSSRIIDRHGILRRSGREIPLTALSDIGYRQTIFDRVIGAGDVVIESAGRDGQEVFPDLRHPARIQNEIYNQMQRNRPGSAPGPAPASIPDQIEQLDRLRQRGVISDEEFAAKKADLLNRL